MNRICKNPCIFRPIAFRISVFRMTLTCPTLSAFSLIQLFTVFRAMSAAGSLGKPSGERESEHVNTSFIRHADPRERQKQTGGQTDPISPQVTAFLLNRWKAAQAAHVWQMRPAVWLAAVDVCCQMHYDRTQTYSMSGEESVHTNYVQYINSTVIKTLLIITTGKIK